MTNYFTSGILSQYNRKTFHVVNFTIKILPKFIKDRKVRPQGYVFEDQILSMIDCDTVITCHVVIAPSSHLCDDFILFILSLYGFVEKDKEKQLYF